MSLIIKKLLILTFCVFTLLMISYISLHLKSDTETSLQTDRRRIKFSYRKKALLPNIRLRYNESNHVLDNFMFNSFGNLENNTSEELSYGDEFVGRFANDVKQKHSKPEIRSQYSNHNFTKRKGSKVLTEYLVENIDPRSERLLKKLFTVINDDLYHQFFTKIKQFEEENHVSFRQLPFQQQWKLLIPTMKELGYEQKLPTAINIGSKKSGTNAFGFFFQQHPQVCHSLGNEVHYFDWNHEKGTGYYKSRMGFAARDQISFEKTPRYFVTEEAPLFILEELPEDVKFILCVRDPIQRAISDFRHESELHERRKYRGKVDRTKYLSKSGIMEGLEFEKLVLTPRGEVNASNEIIRTSLYFKHIQNWLKYYPRDRFLIINHDDLQKNALKELKRAEQFIGLKSYFTKDMFYFDQTRHGSCMKGKPRPCPAKSTPGFLPKAQLSPQFLKKLYDFYRPYNNAFANIIGKRFSWMDQ